MYNMKGFIFPFEVVGLMGNVLKSNSNNIKPSYRDVNACVNIRSFCPLKCP